MTEKVVDLQLLIRREPEVVFHALTDPELVKLWWRSPDFYRVTEFHMERRRGGNWGMLAVRHNGEPFEVKGKVLEYDPPQQLTFTWNPSWQEIPTTKVSIRLSAVPEGALLRLVHSGFASDAAGYEPHRYGWPHVLEWLAKYLETDRLKSPR